MTLGDFSQFDVIVCMDRENFRDCKEMLRKEIKKNLQDKIYLFGQFEGGGSLKSLAEAKEIEDPWGYPLAAYEKIYEQCMEYSKGLLKYLLEK